MTQDVYTDYEIKEFAAITPLSDTDGFMHDWVFHFNPYILKLSPQPHRSRSFGLLNSNPSFKPFRI